LQVTCEFNLDIGEPIAFLPAVIFAVYYTWLLNSLVLQYQENGGEELTAAGGGKEEEVTSVPDMERGGASDE
jgi:hypothetical protein